MAHPNSQTNGASLEDCHTNFFALVLFSFDYFLKNNFGEIQKNLGRPEGWGRQQKK
jgi:hypothetical protein